MLNKTIKTNSERRPARIAINGFGRIGRLFLRSAFTKVPADKTGLEIVAVNDLGDIENLAYLLKYDTVYGRYNKEVKADKEKGVLIIDGKAIKFLQEKDPAKLPWEDLGIDIVLEATGAFESFEKSKVHLDAGAKRVILTAPAKDAEGIAGGKTILVGINDGEIEKTVLSSNTSCTTNAAAPVIAVLAENPGMQKAILNTVHAYTATQALVDSPAGKKGLREGRAAAGNIIPSSTGAAIAGTKAYPMPGGKFDVISTRVAWS